MKYIKQNIISDIKQELRENIDENFRKQSFIFFKEKVKIIGVRMPIVRKITKKYFKEIENLNKKEIFNLCEELLKSRQNEKITIAFDWLFQIKKQYQKSDFFIFEKWLKKYVSNWASCDDFCTHAFGYFIYQFSEFLPKTEKWVKSQNRWLRRASSIILIYSIRRKQYLNQIFKTTDILLLDQDDLVQKGYGWTLKETSNIYPNQVFKYVMKNKEKIPRTAFRYAIEKFPSNLKKKVVEKNVPSVTKNIFEKKLIVILGPTASGKSEIAVKLAKKFNGEIISADSRQIYKGMNIGTSKITTKEMQGIPHHLLNVVLPNKIFTVVQYKKLVTQTINKIFKKKKIAILCGGTGFYIQAVIDGIIIPEVQPDWKLREKLEKKSIEKLFIQLKKLDPKRAEIIDKKNKRRLIRALEIIIKTKSPIPAIDKKPLSYPILILGIKLEKKELENKIIKRVKKMFKMGLEKEVKSLVQKYNWIPTFQTIGYQEWKPYFENKINKNSPSSLRFIRSRLIRAEEVRDLIILHTKQYAKRQITWFKKDKRIIWAKNYQKIEKLIKIKNRERRKKNI